MRDHADSAIIEAGLGINEFGHFASAHEGHSVLEEEYEELWKEIKKKTPDPIAIRKEAIQVAAVALRIAVQFGEDEDCTRCNLCGNVLRHGEVNVHPGCASMENAISDQPS